MLDFRSAICVKNTICLKQHSSNILQVFSYFAVTRTQVGDVAHCYLTPHRLPHLRLILQSAACVIMESDLGAFNEDWEEEVEDFLKAIGVAPLLAPAAADNTNTSRDATTTDPAPTLPVDGSSTAQATVAGSVKRQWLGTDVSAASTLVVLVTALCR